tara:strand:- start:5490 stop:6089 length:600 start_codon:yes stop_codon:yes gene_type:complete
MNYNFIEIGTSNFSTLIQKATDTTIGLSVDGIKDYLDDLPNKPFVKKIACIISDIDLDEGLMWWVTPENIKKYKLPSWTKGCNNYGDTPHKTIYKKLQRMGYNPYDIFSCKKVAVKSFATLIQDHNISSCDLLKVDTEGHDTFIIKCMLSTDLRPIIVKYENNTLTPIVLRNECKKLMLEAGYVIIMETKSDIEYMLVD